jgi:hypothetical protein
MTNQLSIELGLTEDQKRQFAPILKDELTQLQALKKDASLGALKKVDRLREIGKDFDAKMTPLLNAEQQQKFQGVREQMRRQIIETVLGDVVHKLESDLKWKQWFTK